MFKVIGQLYKLKANYEHVITTQETLIRKIKQQKYQDVPALSQQTTELMITIQTEAANLEKQITLYAAELQVDATLHALMDACQPTMKEDVSKIAKTVVSLETSMKEKLNEAGQLIEKHLHQLPK